MWCVVRFYTIYLYSRCCHYLYNLKNVNITLGGVLLKLILQHGCFSRFQIVQMVPNCATHLKLFFQFLGYDNLHILSDHKKFFWRGFPYMISPLVPGLAQLTVNVFCVLVPQSKTEVCNSGTFRTCNSPYHLSSAICRVQVELQVQEQLS